MQKQVEEQLKLTAESAEERGRRMEHEQHLALHIKKDEKHDDTLVLFLEAAQPTAGRRTEGVGGTACEVTAIFSSQLRDARLEMGQPRQREQREHAVGDLMWAEARQLTEKVMDRPICRKLTKR
ncbi:hypothetical protein CYMTET_54933 [Cymbomonas tetramitiformis]|uniref:Uncharacterized protein n=1 Tax=Cymbomonas tetramitiformis TaxID=36881 RepID=A0AAE0BE66_9CHLO|nr:hypothetical protein CYMTET_54933 [Cymbomonas tetramitiformis]